MDASLELSMFLTASLTTNNSVSSRTKEQIAAILFSEKNDIQLQLQVQHGNSNCGFFSVAFATALCSGKDLTEINFIQHQLRTHLKNCLLGNNMTGFPQTQRKRTKAKGERTEHFSIYCVCRQPEGGKIIQCSTCSAWFHDNNK